MNKPELINEINNLDSNMLKWHSIHSGANQVEFVPKQSVIMLVDKLGEELPNINTNKAELHSQICDRLNATYYAKNQDYGDSFGLSYAEYGDISALVRISDKFNRLKQLTSGHNPQVDESLKDTILDMANYLIMWAMELEFDE